MKVKELIKKLQNLNPEAIILVHEGEGCDDYVYEAKTIRHYKTPRIGNISFRQNKNIEYFEILG